MLVSSTSPHATTDKLALPGIQKSRMKMQHWCSGDAVVRQHVETREYISIHIAE
jgi:hypothetical protein